MGGARRGSTRNIKQINFLCLGNLGFGFQSRGKYYQKVVLLKHNKPGYIIC